MGSKQLQHLRCDARLSVDCLERAPRTGFHVVASFVKVCPACWPQLEAYVLAIDDLVPRFREIALRRALILLSDGRGRAVPLPITIAAQIERELLSESDFTTEAPDPNVIRLSAVSCNRADWSRSYPERNQRRPFAA